MKRTFSQINEPEQLTQIEKINKIFEAIKLYINNLSTKIIYPDCARKCKDKNKCTHQKKRIASKNLANMILFNNKLIEVIDAYIYYLDDVNFVYYMINIDDKQIDTNDIILFIKSLKLFNKNLIEYQENKKKNINNIIDINDQIYSDYDLIYDDHRLVIKHELFQIIYKYIKSNKSINITNIEYSNYITTNN